MKPTEAMLELQALDKTMRGKLFWQTVWSIPNIKPTVVKGDGYVEVRVRCKENEHPLYAAWLKREFGMIALYRRAPKTGTDTVYIKDQKLARALYKNMRRLG